MQLGKSMIPDLVSLHDALFVALQTGSQTLLIQTHSLLILKMKAVYTLLANYKNKQDVISDANDLPSQCLFIKVQYSVTHTRCELVSLWHCTIVFDFCDLIWGWPQFIYDSLFFNSILFLLGWQCTSCFALHASKLPCLSVEMPTCNCNYK